MTPDQREAKRRRDLAQLRALAESLYSTPTETELRAAAEALGCPDVLPELQRDLELSTS